MHDFGEQPSCAPTQPDGIEETTWLPILANAERRLSRCQEHFELSILRSTSYFFCYKSLILYLLVQSDDVQMAMIGAAPIEFWEPLQIGPKGDAGYLLTTRLLRVARTHSPILR